MTILIIMQTEYMTILPYVRAFLNGKNIPSFLRRNLDYVNSKQSYNSVEPAGKCLPEMVLKNSGSNVNPF